MEGPLTYIPDDPDDDFDHPYDTTLQTYRISPVSPQPNILDEAGKPQHIDLCDRQQPLCDRCLSINFEEIRRVSRHKRRTGFGFHREVQAVFFDEGLGD